MCEASRLLRHLFTCQHFKSSYVRPTQATGIPDAVHHSMHRMALLTKRVVDGVVTAFAARVQTSLLALTQAGPLCPAVELVVKVGGHAQILNPKTKRVVNRFTFMLVHAHMDVHVICSR